MVKYIIKRIITIILIFFGLTLVIYLLLSCVPGGNAAEREIQTLISGGTMPSDEQIQAIYAKYGLDKNVFMQYDKDQILCQCLQLESQYFSNKM